MIRQKVFAANSVLKADDVNNNLRDVTTVDLVSELSSVDLGIRAVFCLENRRLYTRQANTGSVWEMNVPMTVGSTHAGTIGSSSQLRIHASTTVAQVSNTAGGAQISYGTTFSTGIVSLAITPGDNTGPLGFIVPIGNQIALNGTGCIVYTPGGAVLGNGGTFRADILVVGW